MQASEQERGREVLRTDGHLSTAEHAQLVGRTPQDMIALFDAPPTYIGSIVRLQIEQVSPYSLFGRIVELVSPPRRTTGIHGTHCVNLPLLSE